MDTLSCYFWKYSKSIEERCSFWYNFGKSPAFIIEIEKVTFMSMTLYFAKLNLISDDIFKLYDDPKQRTAIAFALYEAIKSNTRWEKENFFIDDNGEQHSTIIEYSAHILKTDDAFNYIEGWLYKKSKLYYKTLDKNTNMLVQQSTENTEGNRFTLDLNHGFVGYNTSRRCVPKCKSLP